MNQKYHRPWRDPVPISQVGPLVLTFGSFLRGEYDDGNYSLYLVRDGDGLPAYIGISNDNVWDRWFSNGAWAHMIRKHHGGFYPNSHIGRFICENLPESESWIIELWTIEDCARAYSAAAMRKSPYTRISRMEIKDWEFIMIRIFRPYVNVVHNLDGLDDSWINP